MIREIGKMLGDLQIENNKLKQTLTEIKEIAEQGVMFEQILQKISECEGNNETN